MCFVRDQTRARVTNPWGEPHRSINSSIAQRGERLSVTTTTSTLTICRPIPIRPWPIHPTLSITTSTTTTIIIIVIVITCSTIHLLTPHTTHGSDIINSFQHKCSPSFNDHEVSNAMPFTHSPPLFTRHTYRTSTSVTSINNNVYSEDNRKTGQKYPDLVNIVNSVKKTSCKCEKL